VNASPTILLASRSARRQRLLDEAGLPHVAEAPGFEDGALEPGTATPRGWVASLAYLKAWAGAHKPSALEGGGRLVIGADTTCVMNGRMIGTPRDPEEARGMLRAFRNTEHEVLTGVALIDLRGFAGSLAELPPRRTRVFVDSASVRWGNVDDAAIEAYVEGGAWQGKAGAYNLAERLEAGWPIVWSGDPTAVMGLPMEKLGRALAAMQVGSD